jgi:AmmeMemoRadiSam system protein A
MVISPAHQDILLDTARAAIVSALRRVAHLTAPAAGNDPFLTMRSGCFVSLHDAASHRLRGCVGRLQSPDPLIRGIFETAISVLTDPRFRNEPIALGELPRLTLEISVLSPLKPANTCLDFDPQNDGIYLTCPSPTGPRTGTFLPQVGRQTGWSREQLLARLCTEKMGLAANAWQNPECRLLTYQAAVIGPVPFVKEVVPRAGTLHWGGSTFRI